jgi:hypothetical protein
MAKVDGLEIWNGLCIRSRGICPLLLDTDGSRGAFAWIDIPDHERSLKISAYDKNGKLLWNKVHKKFDENAQLNIGYAVGDSRSQITLNDTIVTNPTPQDRMVSAGYIPDLEAFYSLALPKTFSATHARLYFEVGEIAAYNLAFNEQDQPLNVAFQGGDFYTDFPVIAEDVGVKIDLVGAQNAQLIVGKKVYNLLDPNVYFYVVELCNACEIGTADDFSYLYKNLVCLPGAVAEILPVTSSNAPEPAPMFRPIICNAPIFGKSQAF